MTLWPWEKSLRDALAADDPQRLEISSPEDDPPLWDPDLNDDDEGGY